MITLCRYTTEAKQRRMRAGEQDGFMLTAAVAVEVTKRIAIETKQAQNRIRKKYNVYAAGKGKVNINHQVIFFSKNTDCSLYLHLCESLLMYKTIHNEHVWQEGKNGMPTSIEDAMVSQISWTTI